MLFTYFTDVRAEGSGETTFPTGEISFSSSPPHFLSMSSHGRLAPSFWGKWKWQEEDLGKIVNIRQRWGMPPTIGYLNICIIFDQICAKNHSCLKQLLNICNFPQLFYNVLEMFYSSRGLCPWDQLQGFPGQPLYWPSNMFSSWKNHVLMIFWEIEFFYKMHAYINTIDFIYWFFILLL